MWTPLTLVSFYPGLVFFPHQADQFCGVDHSWISPGDSNQHTILEVLRSFMYLGNWVQLGRRKWWILNSTKMFLCFKNSVAKIDNRLTNSWLISSLIGWFDSTLIRSYLNQHFPYSLWALKVLKSGSWVPFLLFQNCTSYCADVWIGSLDMWPWPNYPPLGHYLIIACGDGFGWSQNWSPPASILIIHWSGTVQCGDTDCSIPPPDPITLFASHLHPQIASPFSSANPSKVNSGWMECWVELWVIWVRMWGALVWIGNLAG